MFSKENEGIWIIRIQKHLQEYSHSYSLTNFDATINAGLCGRLMGTIRKMEVIKFDKLKALAGSIGIMPSQLSNTIIPILGKNGIDVFKDNTGSITRIEENIPSQDSIFSIISEIKNSLNPTSIETSTLDTQYLCSSLPKKKSELIDNLEGYGYNKNIINQSIDLQSNYKILGDIADNSDSLLYSEYIWGEIMKKGGLWFNKLKKEDRNQLSSVVNLINDYQGLPLENICNFQNITTARRAGILRVCPVTTPTIKKEFVFSPTIGSIFSDEMDEVKTFISCLRFGEFFAKTSKIKNPLWIINALLDKSDHTIGPATDIGTDYRLLEKTGIVKISKDHSYDNRYNMTLIKEDVARLAKDILYYGTTYEDEKPSDLNSILQPSDIISPEQDRIRLCQFPQKVSILEQEVFKTLRGENY